MSNHPTATSPLKIGNAQGFWGDDPTAPARLVFQQTDLDVLTLDYLAEVSMSILAKQQAKDPSLGYARDFLSVVSALIPAWKAGRKLKLVTNSGGLNPRACALAVQKILQDAGVAGVKIGLITGDDCLGQFKSADVAKEFAHLETGQPLSTVSDRLCTANAYIGAVPLVEALNNGADIIVAGRVADPSLTVAPAAAHFGWSLSDWNKLAGATIAGHLIECGTQVTGGISTDWLSLEDNLDIGFPVVEVSADGSCVVTKPAGTGGRVSCATVKEQLLYEIGDPGNYISPDCRVSFLGLAVEQVGENRVRVAGAIGSEPTDSFKVSATYRSQFRASGMLTLFGEDVVAKARRCGEIVRARLKSLGMEPQRFNVECLGAGDVVPGVFERPTGLKEVVMRLTVADDRKDVVEAFTKQIAPLVTAGPQGTTGYAEGRPSVRDSFGYWPTLIQKDRLPLKSEILEI